METAFDLKLGRYVDCTRYIVERKALLAPRQTRVKLWKENTNCIFGSVKWDSVKVCGYVESVEGMNER